MTKKLKLKTYFLTGLLVLVPLGITVWVLGLVIGTMDQTLTLLPEAWRPAHLLGYDLPGIGALLTLAIVFVVGLFAQNFIGQRLVRKICTGCKKKISNNINKKTQPSIYKGMGCEACGGSGYKGRLCINEVLVVGDEVREAIVRKASASELTSIAIKNGMTTMLEDGMAKVHSGETSLEEVLRATQE